MARRFVGVLGLVMLAGCSTDTPSANPPAGAFRTVANPAPDPQVPPAAEGQTELVQAKPGVGSKGRSLDEHEGIVVTPAKTLFKAKERIAFEVAVPHALNLYKAEHGAGPKNHDEFMQKIIEFNQIKLPQLPAGHTYEYDPETEQLMVRRPVK